MGQIEDIILRHGQRGMDLLRAGLPEDYCTRAADAILLWPRGPVLITTGFYVEGFAETDGPPGAIVIAWALQELGFSPILLTDEGCKGCFERYDLPVHYLPVEADADACRAVLTQWQPVGLIAIERCGHAADGHCRSMLGRCIDAYTAPCDRVFELAEGLPSVGIGDGGNEIGMGKVVPLIREKLSIEPCVVPTEHLIAAAVSNWGGYGLAAALALRTGLPLLPPYERIAGLLEEMVALGYVDGIRHVPLPLEDGFPPEITEEILTALHGVLSAAQTNTQKDG